MADDDKTADEPKPIAPTAPAPQSSSPRQSSGRPSEWTASDGRGPLEKAEDGEESTVDLQETGSYTGPSSSSHAGFGPKPESDASVATPVDVPKVSQQTMGAPTVAATAPYSPPTPQSRSLWPVAAAIVLGALVGGGSAYFLYGYMAQAPGQDAKIASLSARVDALEKRPDPGAAVAKVEAAVAALKSSVASLQEAGASKPAGEAASPLPSTSAATTAEKSGETSQASASGAEKPAESSQATSQAPAPAAPDLGPLNQKVAALQAELETLKQQGADTKALQQKVAALEGTLAGMKTATAAAQASVTTVQGEQKSLAGRVMVPALAVVADSLVQQIDQGQPYATQVDALVALDADPAKIAVLRQNAARGVPSAKMLAAKFEPLAEPIEATAQKLPPNADFLERLKSGALSMVSVRRADDPSGNDLPSRVARIKLALTHDDVPGALAAWDALPADAKAKSAAWGAFAKTAAEAMNAAHALQHDAIAALAVKKS